MIDLSGLLKNTLIEGFHERLWVEVKLWYCVSSVDVRANISEAIS